MTFRKDTNKPKRSFLGPRFGFFRFYGFVVEDPRQVKDDLRIYRPAVPLSRIFDLGPKITRQTQRILLGRTALLDHCALH